MMIWVKRIAGSLLLLAVTVGAGWLIYDRVAAALEEPEEAGRGDGAAVAVEVQPVETGTIRHLRTFTGSLEARAEYEAAPRIAGRLESLAVDIGDTVERGQVIAELDDEEYQQDIEQARAELLVAQANREETRSELETARRNYERMERLLEQEVASESDYDTARSRYEAAQAAVRVADAQVTQAQAALRATEVRLSYTRIRATWQDGRSRSRVVGERFADEGATLSANSPVMTLLDIDTLIGVVHVTERDYTQLAIGQEATVHTASNPDHEVTGRIVRLAPRFREGSRQARVEIELPNPDQRLKPGMFARISLELDRADQATIVPRQALVEREGQQGIFLANDAGDTAEFVPVTLGIRQGGRAQVLEPADLAGRVVTLGQHLLAEGSAIVIPGDEPASAQTDSPRFGSEARR